MIIFRVVKFVDRAFEWLIQVLIAVMLVALVVVTFSQIILRNFFHTGISWAEIGARHAVVWITFLGAMIATRSRQHLKIDAVTRLFPKRARYGLHILLDAFAAIICFMLAKAAYKFVLDERAMGEALFLGVQSWVVQSIIPFGFAMMSLEYFIGFIADIASVINPKIPKRYNFGGDE